LCSVTSVPSSPAERFDAGTLERVLVEIEAANGAAFGVTSLVRLGLGIRAASRLH
jgi:hypothetical protein